MIQALVVGGGMGLINGFLARFSLTWAIKKSDKVFYGIWAAGFFYRLLFTSAALWLLLKHPVLPLVPVILSLLAGQFVPQIFPVVDPETGRAA